VVVQVNHFTVAFGLHQLAQKGIAFCSVVEVHTVVLKINTHGFTNTWRELPSPYFHGEVFLLGDLIVDCAIHSLSVFRWSCLGSTHLLRLSNAYKHARSWYLLKVNEPLICKRTLKLDLLRHQRHLVQPNVRSDCLASVDDRWHSVLDVYEKWKVRESHNLSFVAGALIKCFEHHKTKSAGFETCVRHLYFQIINLVSESALELS